MASPTKQTWEIRDKKHRSNKINLKTSAKRLRKNIALIAKLSSE